MVSRAAFVKSPARRRVGLASRNPADLSDLRVPAVHTIVPEGIEWVIVTQGGSKMAKDGKEFRGARRPVGRGTFGDLQSGGQREG